MTKTTGKPRNRGLRFGMLMALMSSAANGVMAALMIIGGESFYDIFQQALVTAAFALAAIGLLAMARDSEK